MRLGLTVALLGAVWWPARPGGTDGFPFSTYPMFGYARAPTSVVDIVLGVDSNEDRVPLTPWHVGGTPRPKHALHAVQTAVANGRAADLCREVAQRSRSSPLPRVVYRLEVVTEHWDTRGSMAPDAAPQRRRVHARCMVR